MKPAGDMKPTAAGAEFSRRAARRIFGIAMAVALLPGEGQAAPRSDPPAPTLRPQPKAAGTATAKKLPETASIPMPVLRPDRTAPNTTGAARAPGSKPGEAVPAAAKPAAAPGEQAVPLPPMRPANAPVREKVLAEDELANLSGAIEKLRKNEFDNALALKAKLSDPAAKTLFDWFHVRDVSLHAGFEKILAFMDRHPDWPHDTTLRARLEAAAFFASPPASDVIAVFRRYEPRTGIGMAVLARAHLANGDTKKAAHWVRKAWREHTLTGGEEKLIGAEFAKLLRDEDHKARLDFLLYRDYSSAAARMAKQIGAKAVALANMRRAVSARARNAGKLLDGLDAETRKDPVAQLSRIQWLRRSGKDVLATGLMLAAPRTDDKLVDGWQWWEERRVLTREMLDMNDPKSAYRLAADHEISHNVARAEAKFLAGWIALRYLEKPKDALEQFKALRASVTTPISVARAEYWLGRADEALGNKETAQRHFEAASRFPTTYYGQLAHLRVSGTAVLTLPPDPQPTQAERKWFRAQPQIRAALMLEEMGDSRMAGSFLRNFAENAKSPSHIVLAGELSEQLDMISVAVRIGKNANNDGHPVAQLAFLTGGIPHFEPAGDPVEPALLYAIARQESLFHPQALSPAGARGLMQLMPATAKRTAKHMSIPFSTDRLTADPSYNARIGSAHLGELLAEYNGSYIMTIAAYNAGGRRVGQWVAAHGDPRKPGVAPIDWIERIPFSETRNYVQRVLENLQVYRARLNGERHPIELAADFARGR